MSSTSSDLHLSAAELAAWLRLALTPGVGNSTARRLLTRFGSPQAVLAQTHSALQDCASSAQATALSSLPPDWDKVLYRTQAWLQARDQGIAHALVTLGDPRYPPALLQTEDPPLMLYVTGPSRWLEQPAPLLDHRRALAIVGSRNPTPQGDANAHQFGQALASQGWCVVSGMALGIDAAAHQGALQAPRSDQACTVAVLGTGLDVIYPRRHTALAQQIAAHGLLLSEYPLGTPPLAPNFPKRNRLISGLSAGTLVVEAALASGSLITARMAAEQGREVFAIPGSIHAPQSKGCHALLRQGAKLVETVQDMLDELQPWPNAAAPAQTAATPTTASAEHPLLTALGFDPMGLDQLQALTGWDTAALQAWLLEQELDGQVARLPGGLFQRLVHS
ncbi:MAG: DNA-processing protein DprA [Acidovorax sp.]|jgi:DNA processing protein|nr:DNA-processing protein DprA [Acidovorax sp.]